MLKFEGMPIPAISKIKIIFGNATHGDFHLPVPGGASVRRSGRVAPRGPPFRILEPCALKGARAVFRGLGAGDASGYPTGYRKLKEGLEKKTA